MILRQLLEPNELSSGGKGAVRPDKAGAVNPPGEVFQQVSAQRGTKADESPECQTDLTARRWPKLNADQATLLVIGLLLAVAIVIAAMIVSKNL